jgi:hypothetical protein
VHALRAALAESRLRRALVLYLVFIVTEEAVWLGILLYAHDVGGATAVGLVAVAQLVPAMVFAPAGSTVLDRLTLRARLTLAFGSIAVAVGLLAGLLLLGAPAWAVLLAAVLSTVVITLGRPAYYGGLPMLAEMPSHLVAANAVTGTIEALGVLLGPLTVAVALTVSGIGPLFAVLAALLALGTVLLAATHATGHAGADRPEEHEPFLRSAAEGVREVRRIPGALVLLGLVGLGFVLQGALDVLGVVFAIEVLEAGEQGASLIAASNGLGLLLGAAAAVVLVGVARLSPVFVLGAVAGGGLLAAVGLTDTLLAALVFVVLSGVARSFADVSGRTLLHRNADDRVMARVFGIREAVLTGGLAVGAALAPVAVALVGARGAFVAVGVLFAVPAVLSLRLLAHLDTTGVLARQRIALLRRLSLFAPLGVPEIERLAMSSAPSHPVRGDVLIRQGDVGDRFYAVESGEYCVDVDGVEVARLGAGDYFGEIALLRDVLRTATVTCTRDGSLLVLDRDVFLTAMTMTRPSQDGQVDR